MNDGIVIAVSSISFSSTKKAPANIYPLVSKGALSKQAGKRPAKELARSEGKINLSKFTSRNLGLVEAKCKISERKMVFSQRTPPPQAFSPDPAPRKDEIGCPSMLVLKDCRPDSKTSKGKNTLTIPAPSKSALKTAGSSSEQASFKPKLSTFESSSSQIGSSKLKIRSIKEHADSFSLKTFDFSKNKTPKGAKTPRLNSQQVENNSDIAFLPILYEKTSNKFQPKSSLSDLCLASFSFRDEVSKERHRLELEKQLLDVFPNGFPKHEGEQELLNLRYGSVEKI